MADQLAHITSMEEAGGRLEVVMFPWLAFRHMLPFLDLSKRLAARGHAVAFVSTPRNLARLPPVSSHLSGRLRFVPLPLPRVNGLPEGAESTADVPPGEDGLLKMAMDGLAAPLAAFLADAVTTGTRPDWIVHDFCHHWVPPIADEHKIVLAGLAAFMGSRGANTAHPHATLEEFTVVPGWYPFPSTVAYRRHEAGWLAGTFRHNASGVPDIHRMWQINKRCRVAIYCSCGNVESGMLALLTGLFQKC